MPSAASRLVLRMGKGARRPVLRKGVVEGSFAYGGLQLDGSRVVSVDTACPFFGGLPAPVAAGTARVAVVNGVPIVSDRQMRLMLGSLPVESVALDVEGALTNVAASPQPSPSPFSSSTSSAPFAALAEAYVAGSVLAADVAAACHSYDSESQRVLLNADVDYRAHHAAMRLLRSRPMAFFFSSARGAAEAAAEEGGTKEGTPCAAATVAMLCGLWLGEGSAVGLGPLRRVVYAPLLRQFSAHARALPQADIAVCDGLDCVAAAMEAEADGLSNTDAVVARLEALAPLLLRGAASGVMLWDASLRVAVRATRHAEWPAECGANGTFVAADGLVCVLRAL